jgi:hypothetical protein
MIFFIGQHKHSETPVIYIVVLEQETCHRVNVEEHLNDLPWGSLPRIGHRLDIALVVETCVSKRPVSEKTIGAEPYATEGGAIAECQVTAAVDKQLVHRRDLDSLPGLRNPPGHRDPLI